MHDFKRDEVLYVFKKTGRWSQYTVGSGQSAVGSKSEEQGEQRVVGRGELVGSGQGRAKNKEYI